MTLATPAQARIEAAFGADLTQPAGWTWTDLTSRLRERQPVPITRGRADESSRLQPSKVSCLLENTDGNLTPRNPVSTWWPNVDRGLPFRVSVLAGPAYLYVPSGGARTPDSAAYAVTDLHVRAELSLDYWRPGQTIFIGGQYVTATNQRGWFFGITADGQLVVQWTTDGLAGTINSLASLVVVPIVSGRLAVGVKLDVNNGAAGRTATFETAPTLTGPWTDLAVRTVAGTTSIFNGTAPLEVGNILSGGSTPLRGDLHRFRLLNAINGTPVADPDFAQTPGTTSFADSQGRTWTLTGGASITNRQTRFVGQVAELAPSWDDAAVLVDVQVTAAGVLRRLTQGAKPLKSSLTRLITAPVNKPGVTSYWPLEDGRDSMAAASPTPGTGPMGWGGSFSFAGDSSLPASDALVSVNGGQAAGFSGRARYATPGQWAVDLVVRIPTPETNPTQTPLLVVYTNGSLRSWRINISDTQLALVGTAVDGSTPILQGVTPSEFFTGWTLLRLEAVQNGGNIDWDVTWVPLGTGIAFTMSNSVAGTAGRVTSVANLFTAPPDGISFGHIVVTRDRPVGWLAGADTAWVGETAADRVERLCNEEGVPIQIVGDPAASEPMGPQRPITLVNLLYECADADMGVLSELRRIPGLSYRTRSSLYNQTPALALDSAAGHVKNPFAPILDDQRIRNDVTVQRPEGSERRLVDETAVEFYDESVTVNVESDDRLSDHAAWRLHLGTWPEMRYPTITTELRVADELIADWLDVLEGDRVTVDNLPAQHPTDLVDLLIEGSTETITHDFWTLALNNSPGGPWTVGVLDDAAYRLDTDGSELASGITSSATSLSVAITDGPLWTTDAAEFPLDIEIGGERMTVSAISGASSPQTFTVSARSVNGVVKAHSAGAAVNVADPFVPAL